MKNLIQHANGMSSFNLLLLNDRQKISMFNQFDKDEVLHIGISEDKEDMKLLTKKGIMHKLEFDSCKLIAFEIC